MLKYLSSLYGAFATKVLQICMDHRSYKIFVHSCLAFILTEGAQSHTEHVEGTCWDKHYQGENMLPKIGCMGLISSETFAITFITCFVNLFVHLVH